MLAAGTLGSTFDLLVRIDAARRAGYTGLGLRAEDYTRTVEGGHSPAELRSRIADAGLRVVEVQHVPDWAADGDRGASSAVIEAGCYGVADSLGADYLIVSDSDLRCGWDEAVGRFAALSARAAEHGLAVALEFLPWGNIPDARTAWRLVEQCGAANAGILVDAWHHFRGAADKAMIREIPAARVHGVQISDAHAEICGSLREDTVNERLLPGRGDFDLTGFVHLLDGMGVQAPWSVEVLSREVRAADPVEVAVQSARATRKVLRRAREARDDQPAHPLRSDVSTSDVP